MSDDLNPDFGISDTHPTDSSADAADAGDAVFGTASSDYTSSTDTTYDTDESTDSEPTDDPADDPSAAESDESVTATFEGTSYDAGPATFDADGDGTNDTAVQDHGYQVEYYVDSDGDGQADELVVTDADGTVVSHTENVDGSWQETSGDDVAAGGSPGSSTDSPGSSADEQAPGGAQPMSKFPGSDDDSSSGSSSGGSSSSDSSSGGSSSDDSTSSDSSADDSTSSDSSSEDSTSGGDSSGGGMHHDGGAGTETTGSDDDASSEKPSGDESAGDGSSNDTAGTTSDMTVSIDGEDIVVGEPTLDITGDGVADTVVVENDGNVEYYVDTDQDGVADQIIVLDENDGTLVNHEVYDPATGTWTNVTDDTTSQPN